LRSTQAKGKVTGDIIIDYYLKFRFVIGPRMVRRQSSMPCWAVFQLNEEGQRYIFLNNYLSKEMLTESFVTAAIRSTFGPKPK
jgi:hypothetical protein